MIECLKKRQAGGGTIEAKSNEHFRLELPPNVSNDYVLAQLDDYMHLRRGQFPHQPPVTFELEARVSAPDLPGTWGFGLWNDPFSAGFGAGGMRRLLPVLPNAAWFFYGSAPNYLSLRNGLPGDGFHAKVFQSPRLPSFLSLLAVPVLPLFLWPVTASGLRRLARMLVKEDAMSLPVDVTEWHHYHLLWQEQQVDFKIDGRSIFSTNISPRGRLGLVIWIDNQYFKFTPEGKIGLGLLRTFSLQSLEIHNLTLG
ncbi:MAG: hypothetical protein ACOCYU_05055 [Brevefilum sp.]